MFSNRTKSPPTPKLFALDQKTLSKHVRGPASSFSLIDPRPPSVPDSDAASDSAAVALSSCRSIHSGSVSLSPKLNVLPQRPEPWFRFSYHLPRSACCVHETGFPVRKVASERATSHAGHSELASVTTTAPPLQGGAERGSPGDALLHSVQPTHTAHLRIRITHLPGSLPGLSMPESGLSACCRPSASDWLKGGRLRLPPMGDL